jgi:acyl carrier protein
MKIDSILKEIFKDILKINNNEINSIDQNKSKNWDSVNHMNLILEIERRFDIILDENDVIKIKDYKSCHKLINNKLND